MSKERWIPEYCRSRSATNKPNIAKYCLDPVQTHLYRETAEESSDPTVNRPDHKPATWLAADQTATGQTRPTSSPCESTAAGLAERTPWSKFCLSTDSSIRCGSPLRNRVITSQGVAVPTLLAPSPGRVSCGRGVHSYSRSWRRVRSRRRARPRMGPMLPIGICMLRLICVYP